MIYPHFSGMAHDRGAPIYFAYVSYTTTLSATQGFLVTTPTDHCLCYLKQSRSNGSNDTNDRQGHCCQFEDPCAFRALLWITSVPLSTYVMASREASPLSH